MNQITVRYVGRMEQPFAERLPGDERIRVNPGEPFTVSREDAEFLVSTYPDRYEVVTPEVKPSPRLKRLDEDRDE